jgi:DNA-binding IclR family transcriptional regulator
MSNAVSLRAPEAACLEALRSGPERKVLVALRVGLNIRQTNLAIEALESLGLATANGHRTWHLTPRGQAADVVIASAVRKRGRPPGTGSSLGPSAVRLRALLDRPRHGAELPALLGVTRQRVHQLVVALFALDLIRLADPNCPTFAIARQDDRSVLLRQEQERVLSAFPEAEATTLSKVAVVTGMSRGKLAGIVESLRDAGLIAQSRCSTYGELYRLTAAGLAHWQRSATARQADIPPPSFRSDRIREVLSHLANRGPTRTRDIGLRLGLPHQSLNALMQYLKRRKAVRTQSGARFAPYELTPDGREMLAAMQRQQPQAVAA